MVLKYICKRKEPIKRQVSFLCPKKGVRKVDPQIDNNYKYHVPKPGQAEKYDIIRMKAKELAYLMNDVCPDSRERSLAHTNLEQAVMWANAAIARNE